MNLLLLLLLLWFAVPCLPIGGYIYTRWWHVSRIVFNTSSLLFYFLLGCTCHGRPTSSPVTLIVIGLLYFGRKKVRRANAKREENNLIQCDSLLLPAHCHVFLPGFAFGFFLFALSFLSRFFFPRVSIFDNEFGKFGRRASKNAETGGRRIHIERAIFMEALLTSERVMGEDQECLGVGSSHFLPPPTPPSLSLYLLSNMVATTPCVNAIYVTDSLSHYESFRTGATSAERSRALFLSLSLSVHVHAHSVSVIYIDWIGSATAQCDGKSETFCDKEMKKMASASQKKALSPALLSSRVFSIQHGGAQSLVCTAAVNVLGDHARPKEHSLLIGSPWSVGLSLTVRLARVRRASSRSSGAFLSAAAAAAAAV